MNSSDRLKVGAIAVVLLAALAVFDWYGSWESGSGQITGAQVYQGSTDTAPDTISDAMDQSGFKRYILRDPSGRARYYGVGINYIGGDETEFRFTIYEGVSDQVAHIDSLRVKGGFAQAPNPAESTKKLVDGSTIELTSVAATKNQEGYIISKTAYFTLRNKVSEQALSVTSTLKEMESKTYTVFDPLVFGREGTKSFTVIVNSISATHTTLSVKSDATALGDDVVTLKGGLSDATDPTLSKSKLRDGSTIELKSVSASAKTATFTITAASTAPNTISDTLSQNGFKIYPLRDPTANGKTKYYGVGINNIGGDETHFRFTIDYGAESDERIVKGGYAQAPNPAESTKKLVDGSTIELTSVAATKNQEGYIISKTADFTLTATTAGRTSIMDSLFLLDSRAYTLRDIVTGNSKVFTVLIKDVTDDTTTFSVKNSATNTEDVVTLKGGQGANYVPEGSNKEALSDGSTIELIGIDFKRVTFTLRAGAGRTATNGATTAGLHNITIKPGWNIVGFNAFQNRVPKPAHVVDEVPECLPGNLSETVWSFSPAINDYNKFLLGNDFKLTPAQQGTPDATEIGAAWAYDKHNKCKIYFRPPTRTASYTVGPGWSMISVAPNWVGNKLSDVLESGCNFKAGLLFDAEKGWLPQGGLTLDYTFTTEDVGRGFWAYTTGSCTTKASVTGKASPVAAAQTSLEIADVSYLRTSAAGVKVSEEISFDVVVQNTGAETVNGYEIVTDFGDGSSGGLGTSDGVSIQPGEKRTESVRHSYSAAGAYTATFTLNGKKTAVQVNVVA